MSTKLKVLEDLLGELEVSEFSLNWIVNSRTTEDAIKRSYDLLKSYGLSDDKIASQAHLLGMNPETISRNYQRHVGLLREGYRNRNSGRTLLLTYDHY